MSTMLPFLLQLLLELLLFLLIQLFVVLSRGLEIYALLDCQHFVHLFVLGIALLGLAAHLCDGALRKAFEVLLF
jgi:hypothetical protein